MIPLLSLRNVSAGYDKTVVRGISFDVYPGEFCALLGLNGSGKTTLLKAVCGLIPMDGGIFLGEIDGTRLSEKKRAQYISYIPQRYSKLIGVTVMDAVLMGLNPRLGIFEFPSVSDKLTAMAVLEKMEILHLADKDFSRLSEGQKQVVILTRTLVQNSPVMLMDEPDSSLDFPNKHSALKKIRDLICDEKKAGVVTLHDPNLALAYCNRLILLHDGRVVSEIVLTAAAEDIRSCLSAVYGNIEIIEHNGVYICINGGRGFYE